MEPNLPSSFYYEPDDWLPYDYNSVMHYLARALSKDHAYARILPTDIKTLFTVHQPIRFTPADIDMLNVLYSCDPNRFKMDSPALKSHKNVSEGLFPNTTSEKVMFSKPETGVDTSSIKQEDNSVSKSVVENDTILA
jgi:hypothetical protein